MPRFIWENKVLPSLSCQKFFLHEPAVMLLWVVVDFCSERGELVDGEVMYCSPNENLWTEVERIVADEGFRVYDIDKYRHGALRVFIENPSAGRAESGHKQSGVTSGNCAKVCERLMTYFTVHGPELGVGAEPEIEVSSPGINRHLRTPEHFKGAVGERVKLSLNVPLEVQSSKGNVVKTSFVVGQVDAANDDVVTVSSEEFGTACEVALQHIKNANVHFNFE